MRLGRRALGLTLIELLMTLVVASILAAVAVPSYRSFVLNSQLTNAVGDISSMVARARSEAVSRYRPVTVCASSNGAACDAAATDFNGGWIIFVDDGTGGGTADDQLLNGAEEVIQVGSAVPGGGSLSSINFGSARSIAFDRRGLLSSGGTFVYCDDRGTEFLRALNVSMSGQIRVATDGDDADILVEDTAGANITCP